VTFEVVRRCQEKALETKGQKQEPKMKGQSESLMPFFAFFFLLYGFFFSLCFFSFLLLEKKMPGESA
jgi:hypothetical protein